MYLRIGRIISIVRSSSSKQKLASGIIPSPEITITSPCLHMANFTVRFVLSTSFMGLTSRSPVASRDGVPLTPLRRLSLRLALASRVSLNFHSFSCCRRFCDLAYARAGVGLNPIPLMPVPSSSGSVDGSTRCPVISLSCHVSVDSGGDGDLFRGRGCDEERFCVRDL